MIPRRRVELLLYVLLALAAVGPTLLVPGSTVGDGVDAFGTHWFYWWIRTCIEHFGDPSTTNLFFYPSGKDIFAHTGNNFVDAVLAVPFAWVFGHTLYSPMWTIAILVGNAVAFRPLARYVLGDTFAAFAATLLWAVNPYALFELTAGRPTQAMCWFLPIATLYFFRTVREPDWRNAVWFGVAVAVSAWTYWFTAYFLAILFIPLLLWELRAVQDRRGLILRLALAVGVCVVLVLPGLVGMLGAVGAQRVPGIDHSVGSIFEPPTPVANNVSADLHGLWLMEFYGAPLLFNPAWGIPLLLVPFLRSLPVPGGRGRWIAALVVVVAFAGGTMFRIDDWTVVMPHYMALYRHLPFFDRLWFPYRMASVLFIPASLLLGALCGMLPWPRIVLGALVAVGLGAQAFTGTWPLNHRVARAPAPVAALKELGGGVIFLPMKIQHDGLMWQTEFQLPTFGGMGESAALFWPANYRQRLNNTLIKALRGAAIAPERPQTILGKDRDLIRNEGFRWVILRRSLLESELRRQEETEGASFDRAARLQQTLDALTKAVGHPPAAVGGDAVIWDLTGGWQAPAEWAATPERLQLGGWEETGMPRFEESLRAIGRTGGVRERTQGTLGK
jgi:hypothetical protein